MILKRFSCCMTLRTGVVMIGVCNLLFSLLILVVALVTTLKLSPVLIPDPTGIITKVSIAFEMIVLGVISVLLIVGGVKRKKWLTVPWLVVSIITITGAIIANIYSAAVMFQEDNTLGGIILILYGVIVVVVSVYCWLVVFSFFQELMASDRVRGYT